MKLIVPFSILIFVCSIGWISSVPISKTEGREESDNEINEDDIEIVDEGSSSSEEDDYSDESIALNDSRNESSFVVIDDMIIRSETSRAGLRDAAWPDGVVPYSFGMTVVPSQRTQILQAMAEIHEVVPCVSFRPITKEDTYNVEFRNDAMNQGCSSYVGWQNRKNQPIQLATICTKGNAIHEVMHALGFFHEQTRDDRDSYVTINFGNIQPGAENNFKKDGELYPNAETGYFGIPYNYDSIMHYGKAYFSKNGANTIDTLNTPGALGNGDNVGQRDFISYGDVTMMRAKYDCPYTEEESTEQPATEPATEPATQETEPESGGGEGEEESTDPAATKPTTKNPYCLYNPNLPQCKQ